MANEPGKAHREEEFLFLGVRYGLVLDFYDFPDVYWNIASKRVKIP